MYRKRGERERQKREKGEIYDKSFPVFAMVAFIGGSPFAWGGNRDAERGKERRGCKGGGSSGKRKGDCLRQRERERERLLFLL